MVIIYKCERDVWKDILLLFRDLSIVHTFSQYRMFHQMFFFAKNGKQKKIK